MSSNGEIIELLGELLAQLKAKARADRAPKPKPGSQAWYMSLPAPARDQGINMNDLLRGIPKRKPPRRPSWER